MRRTLQVLTAALIGTARPDPTLASEGRWWPFGDPQTGQGLPGGIEALTVFEGRVVAGGTFYWLPGANPGEYIDGGYVGAWDGSRWHALNGGFHRPFPGPHPSVWSLIEFRGELIAGGHFEKANGRFGTNVVNSIARWDGTRWHSMGGGMLREEGPDLAGVYSLGVYNGDLIAGGWFDTAGGRPARNVARWDGTQWYPMGDGLPPALSEMVVYQNDLILFGPLIDQAAQRNIVRWDGSTWTQFGTHKASSRGAIVFRDTLIASVDQRVGIYVYPLVSRWNGTGWDPMAEFPFARLGEITEFEVVGGQLYAGGGDFWDPYPFDRIARWTGREFVPLGGGVAGGDEGQDGMVRALVAHEGSLYVGGRISRADGQLSYAIARWDPETTPIAVESFEASRTETGVVLEWTLSQDAIRAVRSIHVERATAPAGPFIEVSPTGLVPARHMLFADPTPPEGAAAWYRLRVLATNGKASTVGPIEAWSQDGTDDVRLHPPVLHAGSPGATVRYRLGGTGIAYTVALYTATGRLLRVLDRGFGHGERLVAWDGTDDAGQAAARGVYFVHLRTGRGGDARKLVLLGR